MELPEVEITISVDTRPFVKSVEEAILSIYEASGKTTRLIEEAISLLGELPETSRVFITGAHPQWLLQLSREFKAEGLVDVEFLTVTQIEHGALRGRRGVLLIDDWFDFSELSNRDREFLLLEKRILRRD